MRVFTPGIEIPTLPVFDPRPERALGCAITFQLLRHEDPRYVLQPLEPLTQKLLCPLVVAPALDQDIEAVVVLVDSAPQGRTFALNRQKHLVEVPLVPGLGASMLRPIGLVRPKLPTPLADGVMGDVDPAFAQQFLHVAGAQGKAIIEPDAMADDLTGDAVVLGAFRVSRWRPLGGLSSGWLGPRGGIAAGIMS